MIKGCLLFLSSQDLLKKSAQKKPENNPRGNQDHENNIGQFDGGKGLLNFSLLKGLLDFCFEVHHIDGLHEIVIGTFNQALNGGVYGRIACNHDDGDLGV